MTLSIAGSSSPFLKQLETNGLTASKAALVKKDLSAAQTAATSATGSKISPATRAAFDVKISADVLSGKLSTSDAAAVKKTMDNLAGGSASATDASQVASTGAASSQAGGSSGAGKAGGGGGGGGRQFHRNRAVRGGHRFGLDDDDGDHLHRWHNIDDDHDGDRCRQS